tara:strand:- start:121 stop:528 length:408 start_codon:yes stop_codon:yes gene_type:complete
MLTENVYLQSSLSITEQAKKCRDIFFDSIGQEVNTTSRKWKHIVPRQALAVALSRSSGDIVAAEALGKDRTTILHARKKHSNSMKYWESYPFYFKKAQEIVRTCLEDTERQSRIQVIDRMIQNLEAEKKYIKSLI